MSLAESTRKTVQNHIGETANKLRRRQISGSHEVAIHTVKILREVVAGSRWASFEALIHLIQEVGTILQNAQPKELVIDNMVRRVIKFLNEEYNTQLSEREVPSHPETGASTPLSASSSAPPETPGIASVPQAPLLPIFPTTTNTTTTTSSSPHTSTNKQTESIFDLFSNRGLLPVGVASAHNLSTSAAAASPTLLSPSTNESNTEFSRRSHTLKPIFIDAISELMEELDMVYDNVGAHATQHIHSSEIILTVGYSKTVESFLLAAARKRKFTVVVAEAAPGCSGRKLAKALGQSSSIEVVLIPDSSIFSLLSRVSKVFLGAHTIFADGSLVALSGTLPVCMAAKAHLVPVVVCAGIFKFCPLLIDEGESSNDLRNPGEVLGSNEGIDGTLGIDGRTEVLNPAWDKVPPEVISLYITNEGENPSSFIYRLLHDHYGSA